MSLRPAWRTLRLLFLVALTLQVTTGFAEGSARLISPSVQSFNVTPGGSYEGILRLANSGDEPAAVRIYLNDYRYDAQGRSFFLEPGTLARSNAGWIVAGADVVTLLPGEERAIPYRIDVPDEEGLVGTYWSVFLVEPLPPDSPEIPRPADEEGQDRISLGLRTIIRYAVEVATQIGNTGEAVPSLSEARLALTEDGDGHVFEVVLGNGGDRLFEPRVWLELYDQTGGLHGRFEGGQRRLYPGTSVRQRIELGALPRGEYTGVLVLDGGGESVYGARYTFRVAGDDEG